MAIYNDFDINTAATPKPWGAREEQVIKDIIDTLVGDTIDGVKQTSGHLHGKLYNSLSVAKIDADSAAFVSVSAPIAMGANAISYDGTAGFGIFFNSSNELYIHDVTHYSNSYDQFYSGNSEPLIYASEDVGASYPFLEAGNLVIQTRQTAPRDITFVTGTTPAVAMIVDRNADVDIKNNVMVGGTIAMGANAISYDGTAGFGIFFNSSNEIFLHDVVHFSASMDAFDTGNSEPVLFSSAATGASYPFLEAGNIILQTRQTATRDIVFVTGTTPGVRMVVDRGGVVGINNTTPSTSAHAEYGDLIVGNTSLATSGITCQSSTSGVCSIIFNDSDAGTQGVIQYHNQVDRMDLRTANTQAIRIDSSQRVCIGAAVTATAILDINSDTIRLRTARTITNATDAGNAGDICWNNGYIFVCVATNTWLRAAITTW